MLIPKFVQELKQEMDKKNALLVEREDITKAIRKGKEWFLREEKAQASAKDMVAGAVRMAELIDQLTALDLRIKDVDIIVAAKLEAFLGDFVAKVGMPERISDAGDVVGNRAVFATPIKLEDSEYVEVTPNDIWFLKLIKQALGANNIEIIRKDAYYNR